jgi:L-ascorbate metabolism protein UlaG (beta-lactamase superfamily)
VPPPFDGLKAKNVDAVLCTHEHLDHFDQETVSDIARVSPNARIVVPRPISGLVERLDIDASRIVGAQPGETFSLGEIAVHPVPAMHGVSPSDAYSFGQELSDGMYRYLGYAIEAGNVCVYHAGDTIPYQDMERWLRDLHVDLALLPINGRDKEREARDIVGNMDHVEAVQLGAAIGADVLVPMHWDMFAANPGYPDKLVQLAVSDHPELTVLVLARDKVFLYTKARAS